MAAGSSTSSSNPAHRAAWPPITERNHEPMTLSHRRPRRTAAAVALAVGAITALTACGGDEGRMAAAVSASTSGVIVTDASTDLGSIITGWGEDYSDTETPRHAPTSSTLAATEAETHSQSTSPPRTDGRFTPAAALRYSPSKTTTRASPEPTSTPPTSTSTSHSRLTGRSQTRSISRPPLLPRRVGTRRWLCQRRHPAQAFYREHGDV